jgi:PIN domain nuclease of toxin-antitoxin system
VILLLDTHAVLWWHDNDARLSPVARRAVERADVVFVSAASGWEAAIKVALGKLKLQVPFDEIISRNGFAELPIALRHTRELAAVHLEHKDPFDRMLVAQARVERATLVTKDAALAKAVPVLW